MLHSKGTAVLIDEASKSSCANFPNMNQDTHKLWYLVGGGLLIYDFNQEVDGKTLKYEGGTWAENPKSPLRLLTENSIGYGEDTWDKLLKRSGYETTPAKFGDSDSFHFEVYHADRQMTLGQPRYFVNICLGKHYQHAFVDNYRSLLQLLNFLSPIVSSAREMKAPSADMLTVPEEQAEQPPTVRYSNRVY